MLNCNILSYYCFLVSSKCYHYVGTGTSADTITIPYQLTSIMLMSL